MAEPEHISEPIRRILDVLEVIYSGDDFDAAIERKLGELGIRADQVRVIIAIPESMTRDEHRQFKLFK